jgi:UDP-N-acetylmuramoylalanine--D-glutamate ligase
MASAMIASVLNIQVDDILSAVKSFHPIEHRMERVANINGVEYINDSKATNVDSTFYALDSIEKNVVWIAGGVDKGNDYSQLIPLVRSKVLGIVCLGKDNKKLHDVFEHLVDQIDDALSADEAVAKATSMAKEGYTVLLSPACASFDLFDNYEDRGQKFKKGIIKLNQ